MLVPEAVANIVEVKEITIGISSNLVITGEDSNYPSGIPGETAL